MYLVPDKFKNFMLELHNDKGQTWLDQLPTILARCEQRWQITILPPFDNISFHYVTPALRSDGAPVVLKAFSPTNELPQAVEAQLLFAGHGMANVLEYDEQDRVMLLEQLRPGTTLVDMVPDQDERATSILASVIRQLRRPAPEQHNFRELESWTSGLNRLHDFYGGYGPFPPKLADEAMSLFTDLWASTKERVLLHADLHHENVLASGANSWQSIDPKGIVGDPVYETSTLLYNPQPQLIKAPNPRRLLARRIDQLSEELGYDRARIRNWGLAQSVLSVWWGVEDGGQIWDDTLATAELLATIKA